MDLTDLSLNASPVIIVVITTTLSKSRDSSVGIALGYGLDERGSPFTFHLSPFTDLTDIG
jgi:hypothetical protein